MRVLIAPDAFAGTLSAPEAARAIAEGWKRYATDDTVTVAPVADGGPGFVAVLHEALAGELVSVLVRGPLGDDVPVSLLLVGDTAYIESAQACGLHLAVPPDALRASTYGVGQLIAAALDRGAQRVVVGLGGSATNDGGAGLLAALGATGDRPLDAGPAGLEGIASADLSPVRRALKGVEIVIAADVDVTLLGMFGATKTFGPQKGLSEPDIIRVDGILDQWVVATCGTTPAERRPADAKGAGAAGGLGFALMLLGGTVVSGIDLVTDAVGLTALARTHDLVVTGEGTYDFSSRSGKAVYGVATVAAAAARPCIVLAGQVSVASREMRAMGVESAYSVADLVGIDDAMRAPFNSLAALAERVARTWSPRRIE
ncbi:glycerate kinase [Aeromicrobium panaciterrae]|uniref:glycerate kinase family protein n=1 Tax=Aeromicrobium panaciterrae TaxID=363861 RepID=UPI0031E39308